MTIQELLDQIANQDLVLPEFQREYVWTREQAKQLITSLLKEYPVGSLLFWKTSNPPELKNINQLPEKFGTIQVILDGQQRLTTLYLLIKGQVPPYYTEKDLENDPRDLYFNIESGELQYYQPSKMENNPLWWSVVDCYNKNINVFEIAKKQAEDEKIAFELAHKYNDNLNRLRHILKMSLTVQTVPSQATLDEAIDIFDRVNSLGTKLKDFELALTHVTGKWPAARREMKKKKEELENAHFYFGLDFLTRALTVVMTKRALFETIHNRSREEVQQGWTQLSKILDYLVNVLPTKAFIHSTEDMSTTNALIPIVAYLALHEGKFPTEKSFKHAMHWLYAALMWSRYTSQTDQRLEHDVNIVVREDFPWNKLREEIIDQRGRIEVKASDLEGRGTGHPLYKMVYVLTKAHGAVDWFNGVPLSKPMQGKAYKVHSHHIFPQSVLYKNGYDPDNHLHRKIVNEIANRAFLTADTNSDLLAERPEVYLPQVEKAYPGSLESQFVPLKPELWKLEQYEEFLRMRRELIAQKLNEFMNGLISEEAPVKYKERPITELIHLGESVTLEFKSTLQWDVVQNQVNKHLRLSVLKTVAGFLNTEGGTLVIGVEDQGSVYGLEQDLKAVGGSQDKFEQLLVSLVSDYLGPTYMPFIKIRFDGVEDKKVCVIDVEKSPEPVFLKGPNGKEFFIRLGNTTRSLDAEETVKHIERNWG